MSSKAASEALSGYWQKHVDSWRISGQSQQAYCKAHDLSYHRFVYWRRKHEAGSPADRRPSSSALVPVTFRPPRTSSGLSLVFPSGVELRGLSEDNLSLAQQLADWFS